MTNDALMQRESAPTETAPLLEVSDLNVRFPTPNGIMHAVRGVSFTLRRGEVFGIVGESGSGKSVTSMAAMGLLPTTSMITGSIKIDGTEVLGASDRTMSKIRGAKIAMVFQDPLSAFTPVYKIGEQIAEAVLAHRKVSKSEAWARAVELLSIVGIPDPERRANSFPHEFSGGMRQRAMIAMAIANDPDIIMADEPTTALDVTIQAQILDVLRTAQRETGAALVFVSHDLGVIAGFADRVAVMYAGRIVETGTVDEIFARPRMPYTLGLIGAVPRIDRERNAPLVPIPGTPPAMLNFAGGCPFADRCPLVQDACRTQEPPLAEIPVAPGEAAHRVACRRVDEVIEMDAAPEDIFPLPVIPEAAIESADRDTLPTVLDVRGMVKTFPLTRGALYKRRVGSVYAVDGVDLDIRAGETLGLVGESGSGKSTALHQILDLVAPEEGSISILGRSLDTVSRDRKDLRALRQEISMVFQDPMASLDPRMPIHDILAEPLAAHGWTRDRINARVPELLGLVGLKSSDASRYPHEFSGGQRQRISIARSLAVDPKMIVLDEPVSALDVSIQAGVLNLLADLKARLGLAYLFVSHDLSVVRYIADRVSVMYLGRTMETGPVADVFENPLHPYTQALLAAVPIPDPVRERQRERILLQGDPPNPTQKQVGCRFRTRCAVFAALPEKDRARCESEVPVASNHGRPVLDHTVACHFPRERSVI
ncbi:ABC transporter ATP-binding protein [Mycetocola spongiae]|uniref:ABC transporter ATP-binding protein n=1 Tax=Mycetocola spongiae TaxID=2859226 RepID=UPI001CF2E326|nr:ABC transporter ATP-binding protein [Mycetocola spongiae]UCR89445.1 ABC transporter ATP-binding protein [Mycetocola spongiae]